MTNRLLHRPLKVGDFVRFDAPGGAVPPVTHTVEGRVVARTKAADMAVVAIAGPCKLYIAWDWLDSNRYGG